MGLYRYLLALAVVIGHSVPIDGLPLIGGGLAVKLFFIVSGFYMGLILTEKYQPIEGGLRLFFSNRFLRIFPIFWLVFGIELIAAIGFHRFSTGGDPRLALNGDLIRSGHYGTFGTLLVSQVSLLGTELPNLFSWNPQSGFSWHNTMETGGEWMRGWKFLLMPHSWTLSCELFFYSLVPLLNRLSTRWLVAIVLGNIAVAVLLPRGIDPALAEVAKDYFAPLQLGFFASGLLAYRIYARHWDWLEKGPAGTSLIVFLLVVTVGFNQLSHLSHRLTLWGLFAIGSLALPVLFARTRTIKWDRRIGDLSYPLYLVHAVVGLTLHRLVPSQCLGFEDFFQSPAFPLLAILFSTALAWLLETTLDRKLDQFRQRRVQRQQASLSSGS
ncbi:MAG: acyltransferase [Verrucomicrobiae bacterium]|nr:acyltransferase [Verrucomicrobiae bacterium]